MQVNLAKGKVYSITLYDKGVQLLPGSPKFHRYTGVMQGISLDSTVADVIRAWGDPTNFFVQGQPGSQMIVLEYKDRATLMVWPVEKNADEQSFRPLSMRDLRSQRLQSIQVYMPHSG